MPCDAPHSFILTIEELEAPLLPRVGKAKHRPQPSRVVRWWREAGFTLKVGLDGYPIISRAHFEKVMGGAAGGRPRTEPNRSAAR